jgi:putative ABC transport system ATP-binding protein
MSETLQNYIVLAKGIEKTYVENKNRIIALEPTNVAIKRGEFISIMGPSGSGKTTLLNIIGCLDKPTSGRMILDKMEVTNKNETELTMLRGTKIGFVFQAFNLLPILDAAENVELPMEITKISKDKQAHRAAQLLEIVGLTERMKQRPNQLSAGERQRVAIARSLANNPLLILADEPTGNLDSKTGVQIMNLLRELNKKLGTTIIVVTHDERIARFGDKIIYLEDGKIVNQEEVNIGK